MGILASLLGLLGASSSQVKLLGEEGFVDLDLPLKELTINASGVCVVKAQGTFRGESIGFVAELHPDWNSRPIEGGDATFYWGAVTLRSSGKDSDSFVRLLAELYGQEKFALQMLGAIRADAVGLNSDPRQVRLQRVSMKLFFHSDNEDRYAEVFLNIDPAGKLVQFHEKDPEYRTNLVRALTEGA